MIGSTKAPHWLPHFIPNKLLLQEITYQTIINGVSTSFFKAKKGDLPPFPLSTKMCMIKTVKKSKDEVNVLSFFRLREIIFRRHDLEGLLKEHLKQINLTWPYSHEELFPRELSQQVILVNSKILTLEKMMQIDKEVEKKKVRTENGKANIEQDSSPSTQSVSLYNIDSH